MPHRQPPTTTHKPKADPAARRVLLASVPGLRRDLLCEQLAADAYAVTALDCPDRARLTVTAGGVHLALIAKLEDPAAGPQLIGALRRAGGRGLAILTLGPDGPGAELHQLRALELGSDMHLPAASGYLLIRAGLTALQRRADRIADEGVVEVGPLRIDHATVTVDGQPVLLTRMELRLLVLLAARSTTVHTRHELIRELWGPSSYLRTRSLDSHALPPASQARPRGARRGAHRVGRRLPPDRRRLVSAARTALDAGGSGRIPGVSGLSDQQLRRRRADVDAAVGSMRLERMEPDAETIAQLDRYARGELSADDLGRQAEQLAERYRAQARARTAAAT